MQRLLLFAILVLSFACQKVDKDKAGAGSAGSAGAGTGSAAAALDPLESADILARPAGDAQKVWVQHVLIQYQGSMRAPADARSKADADKLAKDVMAKAKAGTDMKELMKQYSSDPGSKDSGEPYAVSPGSGMIEPFEKMALRLKEGEVGLVKTAFGWHVMKRVAEPPPPPPDPLESADILARPAPAADTKAWVQHVLIQFKGSMRAPPDARSKEDADKLAKEVLDKAKGGADMKELMKQYSSDPGSKDTGRPYPITAGSGMIEPFEKMALRLQEGEVGLVKTAFGWHVMKRVPEPPPPPPDPLDSVAILKRTPKTDKAQVKHVLLGWKEANAGDERGKKRERKELEKLVKDTVAKLKKGEKIEKLMAELSEDEGSAKTGMAYPVTPDAGLVEPFKNLSLRLDKGEVGVVKTDFGIHIIQRVE